MNRFLSKYLISIGIVAIILMISPCPAMGKDKPLRILKIKLVADQYYGKQMEWERRATGQLLDIAGEVTELLQVNLEIVGYKLWERGNGDDLYGLSSQMLEEVDRGEADAIIGFTFGSCPDDSIKDLTDGVTIPYQGILVRNYSTRCPRSLFTPYIIIHEMVHLMGGVHVYDRSLMSPVFADTVDLWLDPLNQHIVRLTRRMDFQQGYSSLDAGTLGKLSELYEQAIRAGNNEVTTLYELGAIYLELGKYDKAQGILGCAIKQDSSFTDAWLQLGESFNRMGTAKVAISLLEKAINLADDKGRVYSRITQLYFDLDDKENAYRNAGLAKKHGAEVDPALWDKLKEHEGGDK